MAEVFKIQNISLSNVELIDFGLIIPPNEIVELEDFDHTLLSPQLNTFLNNGTLVRLIDDVSVPYTDAFTTTVQVYNFDSSTIDGSINKLFQQDLTINASLGIRPLITYVDGSLNAKVNRTLFDSSILSLTNKDISQDASLGLRPLTTYVDGSLNAKVNRTLFDSSILSLTNKDISQDASLGLRPTFNYIDSSLLVRDSSITVLFNRPIADVNKAYVDGSLNTKVNRTLFDASILSLTNKDISQDASLGLRPLTTYVDGSLNAKVNRTLFDASILSLTNKNISQDASLGLRPLTTYVDGSLNLKVSKSGDTMTGDLIFSGVSNSYIRRDTSTSSLSVWGGNSEANGAYFQITGSGYGGSPYGGSAEFVIRNLPQSQFSLFSYDGISSWTPRFSLSGNTGLATFSNDVSISGSLGIGNDSSIGTNLPYAQIDVNNGKKIVSAGNYYGQEFQYEESLGTSSTTSTTPQTKVTLTTPSSLPSGTYKITAIAKGRGGSTSSDMRFRVYQGATPLGTTDINIEPQDVNSYYPIVIVHYLTISGSQTFTFRYSSESAGTTTYIVDATLELIRVS